MQQVPFHPSAAATDCRRTPCQAAPHARRMFVAVCHPPLLAPYGLPGAIVTLQCPGTRHSGGAVAICCRRHKPIRIRYAGAFPKLVWTWPSNAFCNARRGWWSPYVVGNTGIPAAHYGLSHRDLCSGGEVVDTFPTDECHW